MNREPDRDASEAEAVRLYLDAIDVPTVSWTQIEARAGRFRARRRWPRYATPAAGAVVAAALLVVVAGRVLAPVRSLGPGHAVARSSVLYGAAKAQPVDGPGHAATPTASSAFTAAALPAPPVRWQGRSYTLQAIPVVPSALGRLLLGRPAPRASWQVPGALPSRPGLAFRVLAVYALRGRATATALAVLGRFGQGRPGLWQADALPARRSSARLRAPRP